MCVRARRWRSRRRSAGWSVPEVARESGASLWRFGSFVLHEEQRRLERHGQQVRLGSRAIGLLLELLKRAGEVVDKNQLLAAVWPDVVVEEASVRVQMSMLRKALGDPDDDNGCVEWIANVPLRGYCFLGRVRREFAQTADAAKSAATSVEAAPAELPVRFSALIGRDEEMTQLLAMLCDNRLVTLVGAGGVGKTSVAVRVAERYRERHGCAVRFIDLAPLTSRDHVLTTVARAIGVRGGVPDVEQAVIQRLEGEAALLLVDNCEHMIETLAPLLHRLLVALPNLRIFTTSREVLRVEGEHVLRLLPLAIHRDAFASLARALQSPAVELLVERARAAGAGVFDDASGGALARICRRVDGIPLAIELVAARLGTQSASDLAFRLDDHMRLHSTLARAALPRQRTLAATLDWSIGLLGESELLLFRRLSVFRAHFDVEAALSVVANELDPDMAADALISLASKSLVVYDTEREARAPYRLLDTTRSYAQALLARAGEQELVARRHARLMLELLGSAGADQATLDAHEWLLRYGALLDDVRAALDACLAQQEDTAIAGALTVASAPLWFRLSEVGEYRDRVQAALDYLRAQPQPDRLAAGWLELALYNALWHTGGSVADMTEACERALASALEFKVGTLEFQARWGLCALNVTRGDYPSALRHAQRLGAYASESESDVTRNLSHRMLALASFFCGGFADARTNAQAAMDVDGATRRGQGNTFQPDARTTAMAILARTLWIEGDARLAMATAVRCVEEAEALGHAMSLCVALFWICPMAIWAGERATAREWVDTLLRETRAKGFDYWHEWALCYDDALKLDEVSDRAAHIREVTFRMAKMADPLSEMLVTFCDEWVDGRLVARVMRGGGPWSAAEVYRAAGLRHERQGNDAEAEGLYLQALELARKQGAAAWEQRAVAALAALRDKDTASTVRRASGGDNSC
jgi:predicted ATPase/DNA-binding winged helix-turn-helix (wHTH) protein